MSQFSEDHLAVWGVPPTSTGKVAQKAAKERLKAETDTKKKSKKPKKGEK